MKKNLKRYFISLSILFLTSCGFLDTNRPDPKTSHQEFLKEAREAKTQYKGQSYRSWLEMKLRNKEDELSTLEGRAQKEGKMLSIHESGINSGATNSLQDVNAFKSDSSRQQLRYYDEYKQILEKQIFYLKSQISSLDNSSL